MILATAPGPDQCLFFLSLGIVSRVRREQINNSRSSALLRKRIVMSFFSFFFLLLEGVVVHVRIS